MNCPICNTFTKNNRGMSYHFTIKHKLDYITYLVENKLIEIPKCRECGNEINVLTSGYKSRFLSSPETIIFCSDNCRYKNKEYLNKCSEHGKIWINSLNDYYKTHNKDEHREKQSIAATINWKNQEIRDRTVEARKGYVMTDEHKLNVSKGMSGVPKSQEHKDKIRKTVVFNMNNSKDGSHKYKFFSFKNQKYLNLKSSYELKMAIMLEAHRNIKIYKYEHTHFYNKELNKEYVPDFYFIFNNIQYLLEIDRYKGFKEKYNAGWKLRLAEEKCIERGWTFLYYDLKDIDSFFKENKEHFDFDNVKTYNSEYIDEINLFLAI